MTGSAGYPVHKRMADLSGLSGEIVPAVTEKTLERTEQIAEINAEREYVVTMTDRNRRHCPTCSELKRPMEIT